MTEEPPTTRVSADTGETSGRAAGVALKRVFPFLGLATFSAMLGTAMLGPILPVYALTLGASGLWVGIIFGAFSASRAMLMPVFGWLSDLRGRKILLSIGLAISGLVSFAYIAGNSYYSLTAVRLLHGAAAALVIPLTMAYIGDLAALGEEGRWMGYINLAMLVGMGLGPVMGGFVSDKAGSAAVFIVMGALNLLAFLLVLIFVPESRSAAERKKGKTRVKSLIYSRQMWGLITMSFSFQASYAALLAFLPIYGAMRFSFSAFDIGILLLFNVLALSALQPATGWLADHISRRLLTILGGIINCVALGLVILAGNYLEIAVLMVIGGIAGALIIPATAALTVVEGRKYGMGSTNATIAVSHSVGVLIGALLAGIVNDISGTNSVFIFAGLLGIPGIICFAMLARQTGR